ncbi:MAG: glycosyltransferase [Sandaracinaceae bacterium]|nr:glycosyltransferase [Sandaracinaceae bacterium]
MYNPIIDERFRELSRASTEHPWLRGEERRWTLVSSGRLTEQKGYPQLLRALAEVRRTYPARLIVLGDGPLRIELRGECQRLGIGEAVDFIRFQLNPYPIVRGERVRTASRWEGFGNVSGSARARNAGHRD